MNDETKVLATGEAVFFDNGWGYSDWDVYGVIILEEQTTFAVILEAARDSDKAHEKDSKEWYHNEEKRKSEPHPYIWDYLLIALKNRGVKFTAHRFDDCEKVSI